MWSFSEDGKLCIWSSSVYEIIKEQFIFNETMQLDIQCTFRSSRSRIQKSTSLRNTKTSVDH